MHANAALLNKLFTALGRRDHETMASCYDDDAHFRDIAFSFKRKERIRDMWRMICEGDSKIEVLDFEVIEADDRAGLARIVDRYSFGRKKKKKPVVNHIESRFLFRGGRIVQQDDDCDAKSWAKQALGENLFGRIAGRSRFLRSALARGKLALWVLRHPERRPGASGSST